MGWRGLRKEEVGSCVELMVTLFVLWSWNIIRAGGEGLLARSGDHARALQQIGDKENKETHLRPPIQHRAHTTANIAFRELVEWIDISLRAINLAGL